MLKTTLAVVAAASISVLTACSTSTDTEMAAATAADPLIGKSLVAGDVTFVLGADGSMGGTFKGEEIVGTYVADEEEICSTYTAPEALAGREFCSKPQISDGVVVFNRRDGSQSPPYAIEG